MGKLVVNMNLTLDGVMQAPGRPDEDTRGNFQHGGWALPYFDPVMAEIAGAGMAQMPDLLFGRRTYEDFYSVWPSRTDNPFTGFLNQARKFVASRTMRDPLPWENSVLLAGEAADTVAELKAQASPDLLVMGSGDLVRSLMRHNLIDQYSLSIHPLVLGSGQRFFSGEHFARLELIDTKTTSTGVVFATYRPAQQ